jgi:hypothetical protein
MDAPDALPGLEKQEKSNKKFGLMIESKGSFTGYIKP